MLNFLFAALPPEINSALLFAGAGPVPLYVAADAYTATYNALGGAAGASDGSMTEMSATWQSPAGDNAQQAFRNHANWLRAQGEVALHTAAMATLAADANATARATMPPLGAILSIRATSAFLVATNGMGQNTAAIAANESVYMALWAQAAGSMSAYSAQAFAAMSMLQPPLPAPPIAAGAAAGPAPEAIAAALQSVIAGPNGTGAGTNASPGVEQSTPSGGGATDGGGPGGDSAGANPAGGNGSSAGSDPGTGQAGSTGTPDPMSSPDALGDLASGDGANPLVPQDAGLYGASPTSPTLNGLDGGVGSAVTLGMTRGGIAAMPGSATGYRLPSNWNLSPAQAFGAGVGNPVAAQPIPQRMAPKGASAPQTLRRRRDQEERRPSRAIAISDAGTIPELEQTIGLGVIEYADADDSPLTASEQLLVPGVMGADEWHEQS
ncbi:PPE family protein [Nocardia tengchongensis]|uniref:PPE family protein n=1 Tax=Nocardia tengchongensis TaxID=2055889 RepID=UPI0036B64E6D